MNWVLFAKFCYHFQIDFKHPWMHQNNFFHTAGRKFSDRREVIIISVIYPDCERICWVTPSQNGLIRVDSSLAVTFDLIPILQHNRNVGLLRFLKRRLPSFLAPLLLMPPELMLNWDRSTPQQMFSHCFCFPYSLTQLLSSKSGPLDVIYVTQQLPTGQHARLQRVLKCEMLFIGLHRMQKSSSGENKSCDILNSLDVQWMCNQVMLLYFPFPDKQPPYPGEDHNSHISTSFFSAVLWNGLLSIKIYKQDWKGVRVCQCVLPNVLVREVGMKLRKKGRVRARKGAWYRVTTKWGMSHRRMVTQTHGSVKQPPCLLITDPVAENMQHY